MGELLLEPVRKRVASIVFTPFAGCYDIVSAALGEEVVVHGALALVRGNGRSIFPRKASLMKISQMSVAVMGSAWRNLTFMKLTTDEGLTGVSEVRLSNRTNALLGYLEECKKRYILGSDPFRIEHTRAADVPRRLRPRRRDLCLGHQPRRDRLLGHRRQGGQLAGLRAAGRRGPRPDQGLRQRLVSGAADARRFRRAAKAAVAKGYQGAQVRSLRRRLLRDGAQGSAALRQPGRGGPRPQSGRTSSF